MSVHLCHVSPAPPRAHTPSSYALPAQLGTALAPLLVVWAFGIYLDGVFGSSIPWAVVAIVAGAPVGLAVWLTTHKRRMPSATWYRLALALVAFMSCVAWIYYFADIAVAVIEVRIWCSRRALPRPAGGGLVCFVHVSN